MAHAANAQVMPTADGSIGQQPLDGVARGIGTAPGAGRSVDMTFSGMLVLHQNNLNLKP